jgi:hypothetical protein
LWAKAHTPPDSVFMWAKPTLRFLWAERKAANFPRTKNAADILRTIHLQKVDYVVVDAFSDWIQLYLGPVVEQYPDHFSLVYGNKASKVYRVVQPHTYSIRPSDKSVFLGWAYPCITERFWPCRQMKYGDLLLTGGPAGNLVGPRSLHG